MNWIDFLSKFGIPTMMLGALIASVKILYSQIKAIKSGLQAELRSDLVSMYNQYSEKGFAPIYARENFENVYKQYHTLGANGVMDDLRKKFMALPINSKEHPNA